MLPLCDRVLHASRRDFLPSRNRGIAVPKEPLTIGGHLLRHRLQLGIFQSQAARLLKVSTDTLSKCEGYRIYPTSGQRSSIASNLGYELFQAIPDPKLVEIKSNEPNSVAYLTPAAAIGRALKMRRLKFQMIQEALATQLKVHPRTLRDWENGKHRPIRQRRIEVETFLRNPPF